MRSTSFRPSTSSDNFVLHCGRILRIGLLGAIIAIIACAASPRPTSASAAKTVTVSQLSRPPRAALQAADYARIESEVLAELNSAREDPAGYSARLTELLGLFRGTIIDRPGWPSAIQTHEGAAAVREAITALRAQPRVGVVVGSPALATAARDLVNEQVSGGIGHTGTTGSTPGSRISAHGTWDVSYNENIAYGQFQSGRDVVVDLLIDDGVADRGHRRNIFDPRAHVAGVACGPHPTYGSLCVIDQVGGYVPR